MANLNSRKKKSSKVLNHEGELAFRLKPLEDLFSKTMGSFFGESTFYEKRDPKKDFKKVADIIEKVDNRDKEYVLKIAQLGRNLNMISYPLAILSACYNSDKFKGRNFIDKETGKNKLSYYSDAIMRRALDVTEVLATQLNIYPNRPLPAQLRKCLKGKLESFNPYKLSKGLAKCREVSLKDAICLVRPKPMSKELETAYKDILEGKMKLGNGHKEIRTQLSANSSPEDINESIYKGTLQNVLYSLRSLVDRGVFSNEEVLSHVCKRFANPNEIRKSKLLPFRFYSAYNILTEHHAPLDLLRVLEESVEISIENVPRLKGRTAILVDVSGSMNTLISKKSAVSMMEVAVLLGVIAYKRGFGDLYIFGSECREIESHELYGLSAIKAVRNVCFKDTSVGFGTDLYNAIHYVKSSGRNYDNLLIMTDSDCYSVHNNKIDLLGFWGDRDVKSYMSHNILNKVWINDLSGNNYSIIDISNSNVNLVTGFSERFLDMIEIFSRMKKSNIKVLIDTMLSKKRL